MNQLILFTVLSFGFSQAFIYPLPLKPSSWLCGQFGNDYKTFASYFDLLEDMSRTGKDWRFFKAGPCPNTLEQSCNHYDPICASYKGNFHTFVNKCQMERENLRNNKEWFLVFPYQCPAYLMDYTLKNRFSASAEAINTPHPTVIPESSISGSARAKVKIIENQQQNLDIGNLLLGLEDDDEKLEDLTALAMGGKSSQDFVLNPVGNFVENGRRALNLAASQASSANQRKSAEQFSFQRNSVNREDLMPSYIFDDNSYNSKRETSAELEGNELAVLSSAKELDEGKNTGKIIDKSSSEVKAKNDTGTSGIKSRGTGESCSERNLEHHGSSKDAYSLGTEGVNEVTTYKVNSSEVRAKNPERSTYSAVEEGLSKHNSSEVQGKHQPNTYNAKKDNQSGTELKSIDKEAWSKSKSMNGETNVEASSSLEAREEFENTTKTSSKTNEIEVKIEKTSENMYGKEVEPPLGQSLDKNLTDEVKEKIASAYVIKATMKADDTLERKAVNAESFNEHLVETKNKSGKEAKSYLEHSLDKSIANEGEEVLANSYVIKATMQAKDASQDSEGYSTEVAAGTEDTSTNRTLEKAQLKDSLANEEETELVAKTAVSAKIDTTAGKQLEKELKTEDSSENISKNENEIKQWSELNIIKKSEAKESEDEIFNELKEAEIKDTWKTQTSSELMDQMQDFNKMKTTNEAMPKVSLEVTTRISEETEANDETTTKIEPIKSMPTKEVQKALETISTKDFSEIKTTTDEETSKKLLENDDETSTSIEKDSEETDFLESKITNETGNITSAQNLTKEIISNLDNELTLEQMSDEISSAEFKASNSELKGSSSEKHDVIKTSSEEDLNDTVNLVLKESLARRSQPDFNEFLHNFDYGTTYPMNRKSRSNEKDLNKKENSLQDTIILEKIYENYRNKPAVQSLDDLELPTAGNSSDTTNYDDERNSNTESSTTASQLLPDTTSTPITTATPAVSAQAHMELTTESPNSSFENETSTISTEYTTPKITVTPTSFDSSENVLDSEHSISQRSSKDYYALGPYASDYLLDDSSYLDNTLSQHNPLLEFPFPHDIVPAVSPPKYTVSKLCSPDYPISGTTHTNYRTINQEIPYPLKKYSNSKLSSLSYPESYHRYPESYHQPTHNHINYGILPYMPNNPYPLFSSKYLTAFNGQGDNQQTNMEAFKPFENQYYSSYPPASSPAIPFEYILAIVKELLVFSRNLTIVN